MEGEYIVVDYNTIYNFKNPVRHFFDINNLIFKNPGSIDIEDTCWTVPVKFRVLKDESNFRTLKFPNILQMAIAYEHFKSFDEFTNTFNLEPNHKRLSVHLETGDFSIGSFEKQLQSDYYNLCVYDNLLRLDIKNFYGRIYTHYLDFKNLETDRYMTNLNYGATNGIIMGNYLSLYFAEQHLCKISREIEKKLAESKIDCEYSYFSDDFYFFCNKHDNEKIIKIFDRVLEEFDLERNTNKITIYDYLSYTEETIMTRYWKKINEYCNRRFIRDSETNRLAFINQLIYRSYDFSVKNKRVFINNFFKGQYFYEINKKLANYALRDYDYHELCYLYKVSPEALLYSIGLIKQIPNFDVDKMKKFLEVRYKESLINPYHDVQLYYYYAITVLGLTDIFINTSEAVLNTENQVLISYYIHQDLFSEAQYKHLEGLDDEKYWLQNYHLILHRTNLFNHLKRSIEKYLIPKKCNSKKPDRKKVYYEFYSDNLTAKKNIILAPEDIETALELYLQARFAEEEALKNND